MAGATLIGWAAAATEEPSGDIDGFLLVVGLLGGLAIFLLGMDRLTEALRLIAGDRMRDILARLTSSPIAGLLTGAGVTAVIQSSSVTSVLVVGFISSGLMTLSQSIGVIIGANVGTTVTAQIVAFKVTTLALAGVAVGFGITFFSKRPARQAAGSVLLGLGLVFLGMTLMGDAMSPLRTSETFIDTMARLENPFLGVAAAALFTALVQSSSATTGIVIVLAQQGLISTEAGIALVLGANIGTAITALLAAVGKPRDAMRAAAAHTVFNVAGVIIWLPFIGALATWVGSIGGGDAREVANAHTIFNVANALLFIGFTARIGRFVTALVPDRPGDGELLVKAKYLDWSLSTPIVALDSARQELVRMASRTQRMVDDILPAVVSGTRWELLEIADMDDEVDALHTQIVEYLGEVSTQKLSSASTKELIGLMEATNDLEAIGDVIETNLVNLGLSRLEQNLVVSPQTRGVLAELHAAISHALQQSVVALTQRDRDTAKTVRKMKDEIDSMERAAAAHQAERLLADAPDRVANYRFEIDVIANLKRIFYFARRIAREAVPKAERTEL